MLFPRTRKAGCGGMGRARLARLVGHCGVRWRSLGVVGVPPRVLLGRRNRRPAPAGACGHGLPVLVG